MSLPRNEITLLLDGDLRPANEAAGLVSELTMSPVFYPAQLEAARGLGYRVDVCRPAPLPYPVLAATLQEKRRKAVAEYELGRAV